MSSVLINMAVPPTSVMGVVGFLVGKRDRRQDDEQEIFELR